MPEAVLDALHAFTLVAIAELGDKSQLVCLALSVRYGAAPVILGALLAFSVLNAVAVLVGASVAAVLPLGLPQLLAGLAMIAFGVMTLRADDDDDAPADHAEARHPVLTAALVLGLAELGDKTQLAVTTLASVRDPLFTWIGATLALALTSTIAAAVGGPLLHRLPVRRLRQLAAGLFLLSGAVLLASLAPG